MKNLKCVILIFVSLVFFIMNVNVVLAADDVFEEIFNKDDNYVEAQKEDNDTEAEEEENEDIDDELGRLLDNNNKSNNTSNNLSISSNNNSNDNNTTNNSSLVTNRSVSSNTSLAKTGINDFGGIGAVVVIICIISAIFSLKKISEYKNM